MIRLSYALISNCNRIYFVDAARSSPHSSYSLRKMAFLSVKEAVSAKISAFVAGVTPEGVCFAYKSKCSSSENYLSKTLDMRMHRLEITVRGEMGAWNEFERIALVDDEEVPSVWGGSGSENNRKFVYISNIKRAERTAEFLPKLCSLLPSGCAAPTPSRSASP